VGKFLDEGMERLMLSRLETQKKVASTIRTHPPLILNWFRSRGEVLSGAVEGLGNQVKLATSQAFGFPKSHVTKLALPHNLGNLPVPTPPHNFC